MRPLINCQGSYTAISGSLTLPEVKAAMEVRVLKSTQHNDKRPSVLRAKVMRLIAVVPFDAGGWQRLRCHRYSH